MVAWPYFCLRSLPAHEVGVTHIDGLPVAPHTRIFPRLAVVPMGWAHALAICQYLHESIVDRAGLGVSLRVRDRHVCPEPVRPGGPVLQLQYVGNSIAIGDSGEKVAEAFRLINASMQQLGLPTHEVCSSSQDEEILGWRIDGRGGSVRPTQKGSWRVRLAITLCLSEFRCLVNHIENLFCHPHLLGLNGRLRFLFFSNVYD